MNKNKPQGYCTKQKYSRYLGKNGARDVWARELLNGMFEIDDIRGCGAPIVYSHFSFLDNYELYEEE